MRWIELGRDTWKRFGAYGDVLAAAISFYTMLSIAPLVVIAVTVAGLVYDPGRARGAFLHGLEKITSADVAATLLRMLEAAGRSNSKLAGIFALVVLLWAASRAFLQIQDALNMTWGVRVAEDNSARALVTRYAAKRLLSFLMVIACGGMLLLTLTVQSLLAVFERLLQRVGLLSDLSRPLVLATHEFVIPLLLLTLMLALIYRVLPDVRLKWRDVLVGAVLTAALLMLGTWLLALLLGRLSPAWLQGAVGSIAVFMVWTYYLAQVFLFGAAFTRVWSHRDGAAIEPEPYAELRTLPAPALRAQNRPM
jgi:membrane protein